VVEKVCEALNVSHRFECTPKGLLISPNHCRLGTRFICGCLYKDLNLFQNAMNLEIEVGTT